MTPSPTFRCPSCDKPVGSSRAGGEAPWMPSACYWCVTLPAQRRDVAAWLADRHAAAVTPALARARAEERQRAADVWNAIVGLDASPCPDGAGDAALDTRPEAYRALLQGEETAAAAAWRCLDAVYTAPAGSCSATSRRDMARGGWATFGEVAGNVERIRTGFGWDLSEAWKVQAEIGQAHDASAVDRIAELAGRMHVALRGEQAQRVRGAVGEFYSVEQGDDLSRILPSERLLLTDPVLELEFFSHLDARRALQYAIRGVAKVSKGPLVVALDESDSMKGRRNDWAKAACLAVARIAKDEKRPVHVIHYSTAIDDHRLDPASSTDVLRTIRSFLKGGTAIGFALRRACAVVGELARKGDKGADVILVTDGVDGDTGAIDAAIDGIRDAGARLWTVAIECSIPDGHPLRSRAGSYIGLGGAALTDGKSAVALRGAL